MSNIFNKELTKRLTYMALFDGGLYRSGVSGNARFALNMRKKNLDYVEWVRDTLVEAGMSAKIKDRELRNTDGYKRAEQVRLESCKHPKLTRLHERIYLPNKRKALSSHSLKLLDAEALAIIHMADGCYGNARGYNNLTLNTKGYSELENLALSKAIYERTGVRSNVNHQRNYSYLRVKNADVDRFVEVVRPFIVPSFMYKLERGAPQNVDDDIVCSSRQLEEVGGNDRPHREVSNNKGAR